MAVACGMLAASMASAAVGAALLRPASALAEQSGSDPSALILTTEPPGTVHDLEPGSPALWNVGVTLRRMPVGTLVGMVTADGGFTSSDVASVPAALELLGCSVQWQDQVCTTGARVILPSTTTSGLPRASLALADPAKPVPAQVWVQARVTLDTDAPAATAGELKVRLTVDAMGAERPASGARSSLADTGTSPLGAGLLALAAVSAGLAVVALARGRRHG